jgi:hypothetical protein
MEIKNWSVGVIMTASNGEEYSEVYTVQAATADEAVSMALDEAASSGHEDIEDYEAMGPVESDEPVD